MPKSIFFREEGEEVFRSESHLYRAFQTGRVGLLGGRTAGCPRYATFISSHEQPLLAVHEERVTCGQSPTRLSWFSLVRSADEPGIVSHEDGAEIRAQGWHDCNYDHKPGFAELSWSECAVQSMFCWVSEMRNIAATSTSCALNHIAGIEVHRWRRCSGLCLMVVVGMHRFTREDRVQCLNDTTLMAFVLS